MKKDLAFNNVSKLFLRILPVQIFVIIASSLSSFVNGLVIGNYLEQEALVALGFVVPLTAIVTAFSSIVSSGAGILCGHYMGKGEKDKIDNVFSTSIVILIIFGILLTAICLTFTDSISYILGARGDAIASTSIYIKGIAVGILPTIIVPCLMTFLQMCNESNLSLIATIMLAVLNYVFALINIKYINLGLIGVGLATSFSQYAVLLILSLFFIFKKNLVSFTIKGYENKLFKGIIEYGLPAALCGILYPIRNIFINTIASNVGGTVAISALAILSSCGGFFDAFNIGIGNAARMLASVYVGERDSKSLKILVKYATTIGVLIGLIKVVVIVLLGKPIANIFGAQGEIVNSAYELLIFYSYAMPFNMIVCVLLSTYQCLGRISYCNLLYVLTCMIAPLSCCYVAAYFMQINGVWFCYLWAEIVVLLALFIVCVVKKKGLITTIDDVLYLNKNFDIDNKYVKSINDMQSVINISKDVCAFCADNNIDKRRSTFAGLCVEEMAGNIVDHGFTKDKKKHTIDVFVGIENDEVIIRLRDDCVPFDPYKKLEMVNSDDPSKNIGIKMVTKISKEMVYQTTFGMNVLAIKI